MPDFLTDLAAALRGIVGEQPPVRKVAYTYECSQLQLIEGTLFRGRALPVVSKVTVSMLNVGLETLNRLPISMRPRTGGPALLLNTRGGALLKQASEWDPSSNAHEFVVDDLASDSEFAFDLLCHAECPGTTVHVDGQSAAVEVQFVTATRFETLKRRAFAVRKRLPEPLTIDAGPPRSGTVHPSSGVPIKPVGARIFLVHGHDAAARQRVKEALERLGVTVIVLAEQPTLGRALIQKLEVNANVAYAVVLMTPDDVGGLGASSGVTQPRARQNVIFELGYFIGRLGGDRVCVLQTGDVEIPSDYLGVPAIRMDGTDWKDMLIGELRAAGVNVAIERSS